MVDLVFGDMEPPPVRIHRGSSDKSLLQPCIITSGKALEGYSTNLTEFVNVVLERPAAKETSRLSAQCERGLPRCFLECGWSPVFKHEKLIPTLDRSDVSQQRANGVTGVVMQMIQFCDAHSLNGDQSCMARVE